MVGETSAAADRALHTAPSVRRQHPAFHNFELPITQQVQCICMALEGRLHQALNGAEPSFGRAPPK